MSKDEINFPAHFLKNSWEKNLNKYILAETKKNLAFIYLLAYTRQLRTYTNYLA